jgi:hypothetical protein
MKIILSLIFLVLGILAVRGSRWAYAAFPLSILLYFPASVGFRMHPQACYLTVNGPLALESLSNYPHMILFGIFFFVTAMHFRLSGWRPLASVLALTVAMGAGMEIAQGLSGTHHCKAVDLIPDFVGALAGLVVVIIVGVVASAARGRGGESIKAPSMVDQLEHRVSEHRLRQ